MQFNFGVLSMNKCFRRSYRTLAVVAPTALVSSGAFAAVGASGIDPTAVTAVITDGQAQGLIIGLAMLALVVVFKILKKVRGAA